MRGDNELANFTGLTQPLNQQLKSLRMQAVINFLDTGERRRIWIVKNCKKSKQPNGSVRSVRKLSATTQATFTQHNNDLATTPRRIFEVDILQLRKDAARVLAKLFPALSIHAPER